MDRDDDAHLFALLEQAGSWPADERRARAEEACRGGPVAAHELLAALARGEQLDAFLEHPAWEDATGLLPETPDAEEGAAWQPGQTVGRYRLLEPLGQGGMGLVFLAEQRDPDRRVALKLIRSDGMSDVATRRFRVEQQTLARLGHPHIAQLYEADLTDDGTPYFAMEWVDGQPIDAYFEAQPLDLDTRLRLFLDVCAAVRHAHQKQVVHRDLKPSNILVQEVDQAPMVKVIDFGIAEALDRPASSILTSESGGVYGTPEFLSPEAFSGDVDTRSDVYALGVLLYELLTGTRPFHREDGDVSALIARIKRGEVGAPSRVVERDALSFVSPAAKRRWAARLRGDLDAIVAKAMRPARAERYDTVADLATDVERFRAHRPVHARAVGAWHHLFLLFRRRRRTVVAAALALVGVLVGTLGTTFGLLRAQREAQATRQALEEAEELSQFLTDLFQQSDPNRARGNELTARELLDQGQKRLASESLGLKPLTRARLSRTIGEVYGDLGDHVAAEPLLQTALGLFHEALGSDHAEVAATLHALGTQKAQSGQPTEAASYFQQALEVQASNPEVASADLARTVYHLGVLAYRDQDYERAVAHFERACPIWEREGTPSDRARCFEAFGALRQAQQRFEDAETLLLRALRLREQALGADHPHVAASLESLCVLARDRQQLAEAAAYCQRSLEIRQRVFGNHHDVVSHTLDHLGVVRRRQGQFDEAEALFAEALATIRAQPEVNRLLETRMLKRLGWVAWSRGSYDTAAELYGTAFAGYDGGLDTPGVSAGFALLGIGLTAWKQGRFDEAERDLVRVRDQFASRNGPDSTAAAWTYWGLAGVYRDRADPARQDLERAGDLYRRALAIRQRAYPEGNEYRVLTESDHTAYLARVDAQGTP